MMTISKNLRDIGDFVCKLHVPQKRLLPSEYAEKYLHIPAVQGTAIPGRMNLDHTPHIRHIVDRVVQPDFRFGMMMTGAGVGKSTTQIILTAYWVDHDPQKIIFGRDTQQSVLQFVRTDWMPIVRASPSLARKLPKGKKFSQLNQEFPGATVLFKGMRSASSMAGQNCSKVLADEIDKNYLGASGGREASPNALILHRNARADDPKTLFGSTPTTFDGDAFYYYVIGTQEKFHVPCPHCHIPIELVFEQFRFDHCKTADGNYDQKRVLEETYYECQKCGGRIKDEHKADMLLKGIMVPTPFEERLYIGDKGPQPPAVGHYSWHVPHWYAPWKYASFGNVALRYINSAATGLWDKVRDFRNSIEGLPYDDTPEFKADAPDTAITAPYARGPYELGPDGNRLFPVVEIPDTVVQDGKTVKVVRKVDLSKSLRLLAVDVQEYGYKWLTMAIVKGEMFVMDHGTAADFATLDRIKAEYQCHYAICDIQAETTNKQLVRESVYARESRGWFASEMQHEQDELVVLKSKDPFKGSAAAGRFLMRVLWGDGYTLKTEMDHKRAGNGLIKFWIYQKDRPGAAPGDDREQLITELWGERRVPKKKRRAGSKHAFEYKKTRVDNHFWDCSVMILMLWYFLENNRRIAPSTPKKSAGARVAGSIARS